MKRCPQCEFIYEDDQSLCDMDGILLVFDSQQLPKPTNSSAKKGKSQWRSRIVPATAALVLTTVLGLVYFVATHQQSARRTNYNQVPVSASQPSTQPSTKTEPSESTATPVEPGENDKRFSASETPAKTESKEVANKPKSASSPTGEAPMKAKSKPASRQKAPSSTSTQKNDSKIGLFIKKTGRLLKKPFKS